MTFSGVFEITLTLGLTVAAAYPIGAYMVEVFDNRRSFLTPICGTPAPVPVEAVDGGAKRGVA